jgi:polysaccharide export outer membrane protein
MEANEQYPVSCPDTLEVVISGQNRIRQKISADGRLDLGALGRVRVEGLTQPQIEQRVAALAGASPAAVRVRVAAYDSQEVFIFGEVNGLQRAVPYRGEETVLELLQRAGGLSEGAEPNDIYVVRSHVAEGGQPEVFPIQLAQAGKGPQADLKLRPFDQVYIGATRQAGVCKSLPPWLRPLAESLCGMKRSDEKRAQ